MATEKRPRVAAIGLDDSQRESIEPLCGVLRKAAGLDEYLLRYDWSETDVVVSVNLGTQFTDFASASIPPTVSILAFGTIDLRWSDTFSRDTGYGVGARLEFHGAATERNNTEREFRVVVPYSSPYQPLTEQFVREMQNSEMPPTVVKSTRKDQSPLFATTSAKSLALRIVLPRVDDRSKDRQSHPIVLLLPSVSNLGEWFRAFLRDVHENDPDRVPVAPPRLGEPADWDTPKENELRNQIASINSRIADQIGKRGEIQKQLAAESVKADTGIRRALWEDGDELTSAVNEILSGLGFHVRDMDAEVGEGEPKREDFRLTLDGASNWEAIVEVKGYTAGTKTNDAQQIQKFKERYILEEQRRPASIFWIANPHRHTDPALRPLADSNVRTEAKRVDAVYVALPDLLQHYLLVERGELDANSVVDSLMNAEPGLWVPPIPPTSD